MSKDNPILGILFMVGFCIIAPVMDAMAKLTPHDIPVTEILAARFGIQIIILVPIAVAFGVAHRPGVQEMIGHLLRGAMLLLATYFFFTAIRYMPIANAMAIFFIEPFVLTLLGAVFLYETIGMRRILACLVGFIGALFVIQPSFDDLGPVALLPLGTALTFAIYMLLTRAMAANQHPITLQAYTAVAASVLIFPLLAVFDGTGAVLFDPVWPSAFAWKTLLAVGLLATVSHLLLSTALKFAPASTIAPLQYLEIAGSVTVGYLLFSDFPDRLTWVGIAIIVASGLYVFSRERIVARQSHPTPPV